MQFQNSKPAPTPHQTGAEVDALRRQWARFTPAEQMRVATATGVSLEYLFWAMEEGATPEIKEAAKRAWGRRLEKQLSIHGEEHGWVRELAPIMQIDYLLWLEQKPLF